jgi:hypothetical protein
MQYARFLSMHQTPPISKTSPSFAARGIAQLVVVVLEAKMRLLEASRTLTIPAGVNVEVKGRAVRVKGPRGTLQREQWDGLELGDKEAVAQAMISFFYASEASAGSMAELMYIAIDAERALGIVCLVLLSAPYA